LVVANSLPDHRDKEHAQAANSKGLAREWLKWQVAASLRNEKFLRPMRHITQHSPSEKGPPCTVHASASPQSSYLPVKLSGFGIAFAKESAG
jgi:hypothetical protein